MNNFFVANYFSKIISIVVVLISVIAIFVIPTFFVFVSRQFLRKGSSVSSESEKYLHRYRRANPTHGDYSYGFVHIPWKIDEDDSVFYKQDDGTYVLISNFRSLEYECRGSCICEDEAFRSRRSSSVVVNGMIYFVAALSSIIALDRAREYYEDECINVVGDECPLDHISAVVDDCDEIDDDDLDDRDVDVVASRILNFTGHSIYRCIGRCYQFFPLKMSIGHEPMHNWYTHEFESIRKAYLDNYEVFKKEKKGGCPNFVLDKEMLKVPGWSVESLKMNFILAELRYFCERQSLFTFKFPEDIWGGQSLPTSLCVSVDQNELEPIVKSQTDYEDEDKIGFVLDLISMGIMLDTDIEKDVDKTIWDPALINPTVECVFSGHYDSSRPFSENIKS